MIHNGLHKNPIALDRERHRNLKFDRQAVGVAPMAGLNSFFVNAVEFVDVCREYPIVFVRAGKHPDTGKDEIAPVAVFGLAQGENLFLEGEQWRADYVPAHLRAYPFAIARTGNNQYALCIDQDCKALNDATGTALFEADGKATAYLTDMQKYLETLETELERTRMFCNRLLELDLMQDMRFEATLPDGNKINVEGFLALDEKKIAALPDATILEMHRNGMLALMHAQHVAMGNMRRLVDRRLRRQATA